MVCCSGGFARVGIVLLQVCGVVEACWWGKVLGFTAGVAVRCGGKCIACWGDGVAVRIWSMIRERGGVAFLYGCGGVGAFW